MEFSCALNRPRLQKGAKLCSCLCVSWDGVLMTLPQGQSLMALRIQGRGHRFQPGLPMPGPLVSEITALAAKSI